MRNCSQFRKCKMISVDMIELMMIKSHVKKTKVFKFRLFDSCLCFGICLLLISSRNVKMIYASRKRDGNGNRKIRNSLIIEVSSSKKYIKTIYQIILRRSWLQNIHYFHLTHTWIWLQSFHGVKWIYFCFQIHFYFPRFPTPTHNLQFRWKFTFSFFSESLLFS